MKKRLKVMTDPYGHDVAFFPTEVVQIGPWAKKVASGVKNPTTGQELPPKTEVQEGASVVVVETPAGQQLPMVLKGTVKELAHEVNQARKWAESDTELGGLR